MRLQHQMHVARFSRYGTITFRSRRLVDRRLGLCVVEAEVQNQPSNRRFAWQLAKLWILLKL